ncbi:hypothetical protein CEUSTIGMA_g1694.t1 [Chlamydomonas eustigma]|uniref:Exportin-1/Importin-beta-like domain-containing protein n=1 Tax=Chlamydomonas eustigma TaxID=1157962 RepID=A0A250WTX4_9CHLO|nr:hypothetical protein CEUSTIGMA_g1694.t1 [Chlamydomonas eustigma]|eukprot:GAX74245.1 hypothetical protein CEUSTIGMA_g1694.t1 [Chlamydomonas eustigma]
MDVEFEAAYSTLFSVLSSDSDRLRANSWLTSFQGTPSCWNLMIQILSESVRSMDVQVFASQMLKGAAKSLSSTANDQAYHSMQKDVLQVLSVRKLSLTPQMSRQLCLALVTTSLHCGDTLPNLVDFLQQNLTFDVTVAVFQYLAEEVSALVELNSHGYQGEKFMAASDLRAQVKGFTGEIISWLASQAQQAEREELRVVAVMRCFTAWMELGVLYDTSQSQQANMGILVQIAITHLKLKPSEAVETSASALLSLMDHCPGNWFEVLESHLVELVAVALNLADADHSSAAERIIRVFSAYCSASTTHRLSLSLEMTDGLFSLLSHLTRLAALPKLGDSEQPIGCSALEAWIEVLGCLFKGPIVLPEDQGPNSTKASGSALTCESFISAASVPKLVIAQGPFHPNLTEMLEHLFVTTLLNTAGVAWQQHSTNNQVSLRLVYSSSSLSLLSEFYTAVLAVIGVDRYLNLVLATLSITQPDPNSQHTFAQQHQIRNMHAALMCISSIASGGISPQGTPSLISDSVVTSLSCILTEAMRLASSILQCSPHHVLDGSCLGRAEMQEDDLHIAFLEQLSSALIVGAECGVISHWLGNVDLQRRGQGQRVLLAIQLLMHEIITPDGLTRADLKCSKHKAMASLALKVLITGTSVGISEDGLPRFQAYLSKLLQPLKDELQSRPVHSLKLTTGLESTAETRELQLWWHLRSMDLLLRHLKDDLSCGNVLSSFTTGIQQFISSAMLTYIWPPLQLLLLAQDGKSSAGWNRLSVSCLAHLSSIFTDLIQSTPDLCRGHLQSLLQVMLGSLIRPDCGAVGHKIYVAALEQYCDVNKFSSEAQLLIEAILYLLSEQRVLLLCVLGVADQQPELAEAMMKIFSCLCRSMPSALWTRSSTPEAGQEAIIYTMLCMTSACCCCNHKGVALTAISTLSDIVSAPLSLLDKVSDEGESWSCDTNRNNGVKELQSHIFRHGSIIYSGVLGNLMSPFSLSRLHKASAVMTQLSVLALDLYPHACGAEHEDTMQARMQMQQQFSIWLNEAVGALKLSLLGSRGSSVVSEWPRLLLEAALLSREGLSRKADTHQRKMKNVLRNFVEQYAGSR